MAETDLYKVLGVSKSASSDEIKSAYRKLARKLHPDVNPGKKDAEDRFKQVSAAYDILSDTKKRKLYDEFGEAGTRSDFDAEKARAYSQWQGGRRGPQQSFDADAFGFDLGDLFGAGGFEGLGGGGRRRGHAPPQDLLAPVELDFVQALHGIEMQVEVPSQTGCPTCRGSGEKPGTRPVACAECKGTGRAQAVRERIKLNMMGPCRRCQGAGKIATPCASCAGQGVVETREPVTVRIPAGADDGSRLRVSGRGVRGADGTRGDLVIETRVRPHPCFRRDGLELYLKLPITLEEAYAGASVEVPTPDGPVNLRIPPLSQSGAKLRLRGKGVARGRERGNLYVELDIKIPDREDERLKEAFRHANSAYSRPVRDGIRL